jgi:hypothetical protein
LTPMLGDLVTQSRDFHWGCWIFWDAIIHIQRSNSAGPIKQSGQDSWPGLVFLIIKIGLQLEALPLSAMLALATRRWTVRLLRDLGRGWKGWPHAKHCLFLMIFSIHKKRVLSVSNVVAIEAHGCWIVYAYSQALKTDKQCLKKTDQIN